MALRFFWRCGSGNLDPTHDYSAGDTTPQLVGSSIIDATGGIGGGSCLGIAAATQNGFGFNATGLVNSVVDDVTHPSDLVMSMGMSFLLSGTLSGNNFGSVHFFRITADVGAADFMNVCLGTDFKPYVWFRSTESGSQLTREVKLNNAVTTGQWYGLILRIDVPNSKVKLELYTHSGAYGAAATLVDSVENTDANLADYILSDIDTGATGIAWFKQVGYTHADAKDNLFLADTYDEPLENNLTIESYQDYAASTPLAVSANLKELDGVTDLPTLLDNVRWAWFDVEPGTAQAVPTDYGTTLSIGSGLLEVTLLNSTLTNGQYGYMVLEHQASGRRQAYRLQVTNA